MQLLQCDGNLYDAISVAIKAALFNTKCVFVFPISWCLWSFSAHPVISSPHRRIPRVHMSSDEEGGKEVELSDDPFDCVRLNVESVPCIVTLCKVSRSAVTSP